MDPGDLTATTLDHLSVCVSLFWRVYLSVRKVSCGKMTDCMRMPFVTVSEVGREWVYQILAMVVEGVGAVLG